MKTTPNFKDQKYNLVLYKYVKNVHCVSPNFYLKPNNIIDYKIF